MAVGLSLSITIELDASRVKIWDAITNPEIIKQYLFGTETVSQWKVGSSIVFKGIWEGVDYIDKGTILELIPEQKLKYDYLSSFSRLEDKPENYQQITFDLETNNGKSLLTLTQENIPNETSKEHSKNNWTSILNHIKQIVEDKK